MNSDPTAVNTSLKFKGSNIPIPKVNVRGVREETQSTIATKAPLEKGKSAEKLKLRLASAVSAKIAAANKDGRTTTTSTNNRGIGYLLQRKQQTDSKLNTKAISFQKPLRNSNGEAEIENGGNLKSDTLNDRTRSASQKSLLNALMSSRMASGITEGKQTALAASLGSSITRKQTARDISTSGSKAEGTNLAKTFPPKTAPKVGENDAMSFSRLHQENKTNKASVVATKVTASGSGNEPKVNPSLPVKHITNLKIASEGKQLTDKKVSSNQTLTSGSKLGGIKLAKTFPPKTAPKPKVGGSNVRNISRLLEENKAKKPSVMVSTKVSSNESGGSGNEPKTNPSLPVNVISKPNDVLNKNINLSEGKQLTNKQPVFEKDIQQNKSQFLRNENLGNQKSIVRPIVAPKPNRVTRVASQNNLNVPRKQDKFQETLLEKLEADGGSCKIAAFKTMEDFSVLRMRVYRIRSNLEQLKREREKRAAT